MELQIAQAWLYWRSIHHTEFCTCTYLYSKELRENLSCFSYSSIQTLNCKGSFYLSLCLNKHFIKNWFFHWHQIQQTYLQRAAFGSENRLVENIFQLCNCGLLESRSENTRRSDKGNGRTQWELELERENGGGTEWGRASWNMAVV